MTRLVDRRVKKNRFPAPATTEPITTDLAVVGERDALRLMSRVHDGTILYTHRLLDQPREPGSAIQLAWALGHMVFETTSRGLDHDQVRFTYAIDFSKDINLRKGIDTEYAIRYALAFLEFHSYMHTVDPENHPFWMKPGAYRLGDMSNAYTDAYVKVLVDDFARYSPSCR